MKSNFRINLGLGLIMISVIALVNAPGYLGSIGAITLNIIGVIFFLWGLFWKKIRKEGGIGVRI